MPEERPKTKLWRRLDAAGQAIDRIKSFAEVGRWLFSAAFGKSVLTMTLLGLAGAISWAFKHRLATAVLVAGLVWFVLLIIYVVMAISRTRKKADSTITAEPVTMADKFPPRGSVPIIIPKTLEAICTSPLMVGERGQVFAMLSDGKSLRRFVSKKQWAVMAWGEIERRQCSVPFMEQDAGGYAPTTVKLAVISTDGDVIFPDHNSIKETSLAWNADSPELRFSMLATALGQHSIEVVLMVKRTMLGSVYPSSDIEPGAAKDPEYAEVSRARVIVDAIRGEGASLEQRLDHSVKQTEGLRNSRGSGRKM